MFQPHLFFTAGVWRQDLFLPKALIVWDVVISAWFCHCWYMHTQCHSRGQKWCQMMAHMVLHLVIVYCVGRFCCYPSNLMHTDGPCVEGPGVSFQRLSKLQHKSDELVDCRCLFIHPSIINKRFLVLRKHPGAQITERVDLQRARARVCMMFQ